MPRPTLEARVRFNLPLRFKTRPKGGYFLLCLARPGGKACPRVATANGYCLLCNRREPVRGAAELRSAKWANPVFLQEQREYLAPRIEKVAELANEKLKLGKLFDRVYALAEKKLDSLEATDPNGNLTKELREVVDLTLRAAKAVGAVTDISVRSEKILGKHMTAERLVAFQQQLQQLLFGAIRTQLVPEQKKALADWMEKNRDKFKPNANIPLLASSASTAMLNPVYLYRDRIKMAFLTGKLMDEHDKNLIRPSADAGDTVVG